MDPEPGTVYLLHLDRPYQHARHYTGNTESSGFLKVHRGFFAGGFAELAPQWAMAAGPRLGRFLAHQGALGFVTCHGSIRGVFVPCLGFAP